MPQLNKNSGPYSLDVRSVTHRGVITTTILNSPIFDNIIENMESAYEFEVGYVPAGYEHRPDLIANIFYGSPKNWWLLMLVNSITDPNEGFKLNERIVIPRLK